MNRSSQELAVTLSPLSEFYEAEGLAPPQVEFVQAHDVPQPYKELLVHDDDMTPTLERFHHDSIMLRVLQVQKNATELKRMVVLLTEGTGKAAEFGAIRITLSCFSPQAQNLINECRTPLGTILERHAIRHDCRPTAFFRVTSDSLMNEAFGLAAQKTLYGRRNVIHDHQGRLLAECVEIMPPLAIPVT